MYLCYVLVKPEKF
ncbi:MAG: hypothetical protein M3N30_02880 [Bacteroidota bacterium]|nr:hypothetical protein [Bacteroidota bacterium]